MRELAFLKQNILLEKLYEEDLDSWHTSWLFSCPPNSFRFLLVVRNSAGTVVRRETFTDRDEAEARFNEFFGSATLLTFGRET